MDLNVSQNPIFPKKCGKGGRGCFDIQSFVVSHLYAGVPDALRERQLPVPDGGECGVLRAGHIQDLGPGRHSHLPHSSALTDSD